MASQTSFLRNVRDHQMTIELDQGVHRSILFKPACGWAYHFRLVTWPGHLAISGDMGDYTFNRLIDMFEFFRCAGPAYQRDDRINEGYWAEKLVSADKTSGIMQFSETKWREAILACFDHWAFTNDAHRAKSLAYLNDSWDGLLGAPPHSLDDARRMAEAYECPETGQTFDQFWDHNISEHSFHLVWCMRAIQWGIKHYDLHHQGRTQADHDRRVLEGAI